MAIMDEEFVERLHPGYKVILERYSPAKITFMMQCGDEFFRETLEELCRAASIPVENEDGPRVNFYLIDDLKDRLW